jgi:hypothetical protein
MLAANKIEYIATDEKRHDIPWVRMITSLGDTLEYTRPGEDEIPDSLDWETEVRRFDCMDCHNRPSHSFQPPAKSLNLALSTKRISRDLPSIREVGLEALVATYLTRDDASHKITATIRDFYRENYPEVVEEKMEEIKRATKALIEIYNSNFFPEMKTDYRARRNHLSHFVNDGCFRCHDGAMENQYGEKMSQECNTCHLIVAQGPSEDLSELESDMAGLEFKHPEDIDEAWREMKCTECHTPESGY